MQTQYEMGYAEINIEEYREGEAINAFELGYFLYYFRAAYVACLDAIQYEEIPLEQIESLVQSKPLRALGNNVDRLWLHELPADIDLEFITISKESPLKFVAKTTGTSLIALTMAVILSGGEANPYTGEFKLLPLAHGIRELKKAFGQQPPKTLPSENRDDEDNFPNLRG